MSSSRLTMTPAWIINMLVTRNWPEIKKVFGSGIKELHYLILSSAVCDVHHPEPHLCKQYSLSKYDNKLVARLIEPEQKPYINRFDLIDFHQALRMAIEDIKCEAVARHIRLYVQKHITVLEGILKEIPAELGNKIYNDFGIEVADRKEQPSFKLHHQMGNRGGEIGGDAAIDHQASLQCSSSLFGGNNARRTVEAPKMNFSLPYRGMVRC